MIQKLEFKRIFLTDALFEFWGLDAFYLPRGMALRNYFIAPSLDEKSVSNGQCIAGQKDPNGL